MRRVNVWSPATEDGEPSYMLGWFDIDAAEVFEQGTMWDGNNKVGVITRSQFVDECLYRTAGGRWVLHHDGHRAYNGPITYRFISADEARDWLIRSEVNEEAIGEFFGPLEPERGPGRPEVGPAIHVRLTPELLAALDVEAERQGTSRAATVRHLLEQMLTPALAGTTRYRVSASDDPHAGGDDSDHSKEGQGR